MVAQVELVTLQLTTIDDVMVIAAALALFSSLAADFLIQP